MIFIAQYKTDFCSYIVLNLVEGYLQLKVRHRDGTNITLASQKKYNDGKKTTVDIKMRYDGRQTYSLTLPNETRIFETPLAPANVFKIKKSEMFIGGVPSTFDKNCLQVGTTSFLGYLKPGNAELSDPARTTSYNTKLQSGDLQFDKAWFSGRGFLQLRLGETPELPLLINFLLRPESGNGFIMKLGESLKVYIKNDKLGLNIDNVDYPTGMNLEAINVVEILINDTNLSVGVNENENFVFPISFLPTEMNELFLGRDNDQKHPDFSGGISDIVINHR